MTRETFKLDVDPIAGLITIRVIGAESSQYYTERYLAAYAGIDKPWTYHRLLDHRHYKGIMNYDDIVRMAEQWRELTQGVAGTSRAAVLTRNPLTAARIHALRSLYPNVELEAFSHQSQALAWLGRREAA